MAFTTPLFVSDFTVIRQLNPRTSEVTCKKGASYLLTVAPKDEEFAAQNELCVLRELTAGNTPSPFVARLAADWEDITHTYLLTAGPGGTLYDKARPVMAQLLMALEGLKARRVLHRNLKTANVLVDITGRIALSDFRCAKRFGEPTFVNLEVDGSADSGSFHFAPEEDAALLATEECGTPDYMSPERQCGLPYSFEADVWSAGVVLYEMLTGRVPFGAGATLAPEELAHEVMLGQLRFKEDDNVDAEARDLLEHLLAKNPAFRITAAEAKRHAFFSDVDWEALAEAASSPASTSPQQPSCQASQSHPNMPKVVNSTMCCTSMLYAPTLGWFSRIFAKKNVPAAPTLPPTRKAWFASRSSLPRPKPAPSMVQMPQAPSPNRSNSRPLSSLSDSESWLQFPEPKSITEPEAPVQFEADDEDPLSDAESACFGLWLKLVPSARSPASTSNSVFSDDASKFSDGALDEKSLGDVGLDWQDLPTQTGRTFWSFMSWVRGRLGRQNSGAGISLRVG
ncbi:kinase-like domain-containing protein [Mycena rebaudengoi]|nr:kinase-like domain-containing protein [Mycena rebaudengoi]